MANLHDLEDALARLKKAGREVSSKKCGDPLMTDRVAESLGLTFPPSLKEFYDNFEWLHFGSNEVLPLSRACDLVEEIRSLRIRNLKRCFPFLDDGNGGHYFVVCAGRSGKSDSEFGCVMFCGDLHAQDIEYCGRDIFSFLVRRIEELISEA